MIPRSVLIFLLTLTFCFSVEVSGQEQPASTPAADPAVATQPATQPEAPPPPADAGVKPGDAETIAPQILPAPADNEQIDQRMQLVAQLMKDLSPATQPASQPAPTTSPAPDPAQEAASKLYGRLQDYLGDLAGWKQRRQEIANLKNEDAIKKQAVLVASVEQRRKQSQAMFRSVTRSGLPEAIASIGKEYNQANAELEGLTSLQTSRADQLAKLPDSEKDTRARIASTLEALNGFVAELPARLADADTAERRVLLLQKRTLEWDHNLRLLRMAMSPDIATALKLEQQRDTDLVNALTAYVRMLRESLSTLERRLAESEADYAAEELQRDDLQEYERIYWELVQIAARALPYFQDELDSSTRGRFPKSEAEAIVQRIGREQLYYNTFLESLDRREGGLILETYRDVGAKLAAGERDLIRLRRLLDKTVDEKKQVMERRDQILDEFAAGKKRLDAVVSRLNGDAAVEAKKLQTDFTGDKENKLLEAMQKVLNEQDLLMERLADAIKKLDDHVASLTLVKSKLHWSYLTIPGKGPFQHDWGQAGAEWRELIGRADGATPSLDKLAEFRENARRELSAVKTRYWVLLGILIVLTFWIAYTSRRRMRRWLGEQDALYYASPLTDRPPEGGAVSGLAAVPPGRGMRVKYQTVRVIARTALIFWPLAMLLACLLALKLAVSVFPLLTTLIISVLTAILISSLAGALFDPHRAALRIVSCGDRTSRYHRRWWRLMVVTAAVLLPLPAGMSILGVFPTLVSIGTDFVEILLLLMALAYFARRSRMLAIFHNRESLRGTMLTVVYPLLPLSVILLIALRLVGYAALVDYILRGMLLSIVVLVAMKLIRDYLSGWSVTGEDPATSEDVVSEAEQLDEQERKTFALMGTAAQLLRPLVLTGAGILIFYVWGVRPAEIKYVLDLPLFHVADQPVTAWRMVASALVVAAAFVASRSLRVFLRTQVFPATTHLDRGVQAAITVLLHYTLVALGAYIALNLVHLNLGALTVLLGTLGLGLGLGLQPLFVNFISGLMILFERHMRVGDIIELDGQVGEVISVSMRSTRVRSPDNIEFIVPNGDFITGKVVNWTLGDSKIRGKIEVGVAYGTDVQLVRKLLINIAHTHENVLVDPPPDVWFMNFGADALELTLVCWFANTGARWQFLSQIRFEIVRVFKEHNIDIPFPQRTISIVNDKPINVNIRQTGETAPPAGDAQPQGEGEGK